MCRIFSCLVLVAGLVWLAGERLDAQERRARPVALAVQFVGKVAKYEAGKFIVIEANGKTAAFNITKVTKITGTVAVGAVVTITPGDDRRNAREIVVKG